MLKQGDKVRIQMQSGMARKYPAFAKAFDGVLGRYVGDVSTKEYGPIWPIHYERKVVAGLVEVDITKPGDDKKSIIKIDRHWLAAV